MIQGRGLFLFNMSVMFFILLVTSFAFVNAQIGGIIPSVTNTVNSTVSSITGTVGSTLPTTGTTTPVTNLVNSTASTNVTTTTGSVSLGNPLGLPLPETITAIGASTSVAGTQVFGNGTIITSMNGVDAKFYFDPNTTSRPSSSGKVILTVKTVDLAGNQITGLWTEVHSPSGALIDEGYSPKSYSVKPGIEYVVEAFSWQKHVFDHWSDGSTNRNEPITLTKNTVLTAYYSTVTIPSSPTNLSATPVSFSQINLSWIAPSNDGSVIAGYKVERSSDNGSTWSTIVSNTESTATAYSDNGLSSSTTYTYRVSAINSAGTSSPSNTASATTSASTGGSTSIVLNNVQSTSGTVSSSNQITLSNFNAGTSNDRLLIVGVSANNNNVASITFGGVPLTNDVHSFSNNDAEFWYLTNPTGTGDIVVTMSGPTSVVVGAYSFSGINQTSPLPTSITKHNTTPDSPSITMTTKFANDWVLDLPSIYGGSTLGLPTCTQQWNTNIPHTITGASSSAMIPSPGAVTCSWTASSGDMWDNIAVEIKGTTSSQITSPSIAKTRTGLVTSDPLNNETKTQQQLTADQNYWHYGGDAPIFNATYGFSRDSQGLHIGVKATADESYAGYFAVSIANGTLFHSVITTPVRSIPTNNDSFQNGMYVQDGGGSINYVTCVSLTSSFGTVWGVVSTTGNTTQATQFNLLYLDNSANQPLTRDCSIVTNGNNSLKVYFDNKLVYSNSTLNLQMASPFQVYLEPETSYAGQELFGTFNDYYATLDGNVKMTGIPSNSATVSLVDTSGNSLASSPVSSGTATLDVGKYHYPISGTINVSDSSNNVIASSPETVYGGDVYSVGTSSAGGNPPVPQPPTNLSATTVSSSQINLSWTASNGGSEITGYKIERSNNAGTTWSTVQSNTGSAGITYGDTGLSSGTTYTYRVSAINSAGTSSPSNTASATTQSASTTNGITLNNVQYTSGTVSSSNQITLSNFNVGTGSNNLLVVGVQANSNNVASITFGGVPLTKAVSSFHNNYAGFWYLKNPTGTGNIVVTMAGATSAVVGAYSFSGVDPTTPIPTSATNYNAANNSPTVSITTTNPNSLVLDLPAIYGGVTLGSPTCAQSWDVDVPSAVTGASSSTVTSSPGSVTCGWTASGGGDLWDDVAIEIKAGN